MSRATVDLNADLGEDGPCDSDILSLVSSASIACGVHAGSPRLMLDTCRAAARGGVRIGAHPSYDDRDGFGRRDVEVDRMTLTAGVAYQIGALRAVAGTVGASVTYVKLHGALYNRAARDREVAEAVIEAMAGDGAGLALLVLANSGIERWATDAGIPCYAEAFADRLYAGDGALVPRSEPGALIQDPAVVAAQAVRLATTGTVTGRSRADIEVRADSICIHGDGPGALRSARAVRLALDEAGVDIRAFI